MKNKTCKMTECPSGRWANASWCYKHWRELQKKKREEKKAKKLARKSGSKSFIEKQRKTIRNKLDRIFSLLIRKTGRCVRCGRPQGEVQLQCSHIYTRKHLSVRWDILNANI